MTDLAFTDHAITSQEARDEIFSRHENRLQLSRLFHNWKIRRKVRALNDYEDQMLDDIGIRRDEIRWAARLPLTVNAAIALNDRAKKRRAKELSL